MALKTYDHLDDHNETCYIDENDHTYANNYMDETLVQSRKWVHGWD